MSAWVCSGLNPTLLSIVYPQAFGCFFLKPAQNASCGPTFSGGTFASTAYPSCCSRSNSLVFTRRIRILYPKSTIRGRLMLGLAYARIVALSICDLCGHLSVHGFQVHGPMAWRVAVSHKRMYGGRS